MGSVASAPIDIALSPVNFVIDVASGRNVFEAGLEAIPGVRTIKKVINQINGGRVLILDASDGRGLLGTSWDMGQALGFITGRFDFVIRARSWNHVAEELIRIRQNTRIKEVQYWGHGDDGVAFIGRDEFSVDTFRTPAWQAVINANIFDGPNALWWWRTCSTCRGEAGKQFARAFVDTLGIRMAGHTVYIGAIHNGLVMLCPGQIPAWRDGPGDWCLPLDMGHHLMGN